VRPRRRSCAGRENFVSPLCLPPPSVRELRERERELARLAPTFGIRAFMA
jgi:hypothetical protein